MLIKIGNEWIDASAVTGLDWVCNMVNGEKTYFLYIRNDKEDYCCGRYDTKEGVIKAMDEAATKINAAQGCKPAVEEKTTMKHMVYNGDEGDNIYACSCCKTWMQAYKWYNFCPFCGREIESWE